MVHSSPLVPGSVRSWGTMSLRVWGSFQISDDKMLEEDPGSFLDSGSPYVKAT